MRKLILTTAAVLAAVVFSLLATLPPPPLRTSLDGVDPDLRRRTIAGAYHIHTTRSDGLDARASVAGAAARAGLQFAIFTDHGDATRPAEPPSYIDGVLCIDAVEISTDGGHYVALGLAQAPYPLGGDASAVVEDVARLGGIGIVAHPDHPRTELAWTDWSAPVDGLEWINADSEWRNESVLALTRVVFDYLLRPAPAMASVFDRPERTLTRWDAISRQRPVIALAAVDAHGGARAGSPEDREPRVAVGPSYETSFRTLTNRVVLDRPLTGEAGADARMLLDAIRQGAVYSVIDAVSPDVVLRLDDTGFAAHSPLPAGADVRSIGGDAGRRLEIHVPGAPGDPPVPWVLTNRRPQPPPPTVATALPRPPASPLAAGEWRVEKDDGSSGRVGASDAGVTLSYALRPGGEQSQFVAAAADLAEPSPFRALVFRARAVRPMRVSVQFRFAPDDRRWVKSIYLDPEPREIVVRMGEMVPADRSFGPMPPDPARSILFVVDLVNARPGDTGELTITDLRIAR